MYKGEYNFNINFRATDKV